MPENDTDRVNSLVAVPGCDPAIGHVRWDPIHSLWNGGMLVAALALGPLLVSCGSSACWSGPARWWG
jgi:hypothetical protein